MSFQRTMEFAWESWEKDYRSRLEGLDNLARAFFYDMQQERIPNEEIRAFLSKKFAALVETVAQEQEDRFGTYRRREGA